MTTGIASHRPLPYGAIRQEWEAMLARMASICPIYHSEIGLDTTTDAEIAIAVEHKRHIDALEQVLFSNLRLNPLYRYTTDHLITFVCRQRLRGQRDRGPWKTRRGGEVPEAVGPVPEEKAVCYQY